MPSKDRVDVHFLDDCAAIGDALARDQLEAGEERLGPSAAIGLDVGDRDVLTALLSLTALLEHGERLAGPRRRAQIDLQLPATRRCRLDRRRRRTYARRRLLHEAMLGRGLAGFSVVQRHVER